MQQNLVITILAAGEGKRMRSNLPKVLHLFHGKPILARIIKTARLLNPVNIIIITGRHNQLIQKTLSEYISLKDIFFVVQKNPLGTGDAIKTTLPYYHSGKQVLILNGDMPLISKDILEQFINKRSPMNILVAKFENPFGYGRIVYNSDGEFTEIVEEKDCNDLQREIQIVNSGLYYLSADILTEYIPKITNENSQKEYYLTDIVKLMKQDSRIKIDTFLIGESENKYISGVNTPEELVTLEQL
jgi:UDP-N-acetylglucosamine diphosphorylase/glucosamine-1-phosphate N-acetyltransferase